MYNEFDGSLSWENLLYIREMNKNDQEIAEEEPSIFTKFMSLSNIKVSKSLTPFIMKSVDDSEKGKSLKKNMYLISFYIFRVDMETNKQELFNIVLTRNIIENFEVLYNYIILHFESKHYKYVFQLREDISKHKDITINDLLSIEKECFERKPIMFSQTMGESIYRIKYKSPFYKSKESQQAHINKTSKFTFKKLDDGTDTRQMNKELKKKKSFNKEETNKNISSNFEKYDLTPEEEHRLAQRERYISELLSQKDKEYANLVYTTINKKRNLLEYRPRTEEEIYEWTKERRKMLLQFILSCDKEEIKLE